MSFTRRTYRSSYIRQSPGGWLDQYVGPFTSGGQLTSGKPETCDGYRVQTSYRQQQTSQSQMRCQQTAQLQAQMVQMGAAPVEELKIMGKDLHLTENRRNHHTDDYERKALIVRRGGEFKLTLEFNKKIEKGKGDKIQLQLAVGPNPRKSKQTMVDVDEISQIKKDKFSYKLLEENNNKMTMLVYVPADAVVGEYRMAVNFFYLNKEKVEEKKVLPVDDPIIVLFNPFSQDDQVFMPDERERHEYVMNDGGRIYVGTRRQISGRPWNFGQFERNSLDAALYLLDLSYLATEAHGNPIKVTRALSALVNCNDDDGVVMGRWSGGYAGGKSPTAWNGSVAILDEYMMTKKPVKYGQCWVFSGVLTTLCRALGIPARSVTNFQSAHDSDCSMTIDQHRDEEGRPLPEYDESIWNFHVWNEGFFKRPDLPKGNDGWQAFDSTPQESSEGMYRCGPAPVIAIKEGNVYCGYDTPFLFAEVNGEYVIWKVDYKGNIKPISHMERGVGYHISTKAVGKTERMDITCNYKYPEGSKEERMALEKALGHSTRKTGLADLLKELKGQDCKVELDGKMHKHGDISVILKIHNESSSTRNIKMRMYATAKYYHGTTGEEIEEFHKDITVPAKTALTVEKEFKIVDFINKLDEDASLCIFASGEVMETKQTFSEQETFNVDKPDLEIKMFDRSKKGSPCLEANKGMPVDVEISFTNPLAVILTKCQLTLEGAGLQQEIPIPTKRMLRPNERLVEYVTIYPRMAGKREIIANLHTRQVNSIHGALEITVKE